MQKNPSLYCLIACLLLLSTSCQQSQTGIPFNDVSNSGYHPDGSMSLTFAKQSQQRAQFTQIAGKVQPGTNYLDHVFVTDGSDDFQFMLPVEQQVSFYIHAYVAKGSTFQKVTSVETQSPILLVVYEGDQIPVVKTTFFFMSHIVFNGKKDITYTMKFQTVGNMKLVVLSMKIFVQTADISHTITKQHANNYTQKTQFIKSQLNQLFNGFGTYWLLDQSNMRSSLQSIRKFYFYMLVEMGIAGIACVIQVRLLFKLLKGTSIV